MLQPIVRQTLSRQVLGSLRDYIVATGLGPGDQLPGERELAAELGVSRNTVREALKSFENFGALSRQRKRGTVLQPIDLTLAAEMAQLPLLQESSDLVELLTARQVLELGMIPLIIRHATEKHFAVMEKAIQIQKTDIDSGGIGMEGDLLFHRALLEAAGNKYLAQFGAFLQEFFERIRSGVLQEPPTQEDSLLSLKEHRQIMEALRRGDTNEARRVMGIHLDKALSTHIASESKARLLSGGQARGRRQRR